MSLAYILKLNVKSLNLIFMEGAMLDSEVKGRLFKNFRHNKTNSYCVQRY